MPERELVVVASRNCPNCGTEKGEKNTDYDCPCCGKSFCSHCYKPDFRGLGNYVFCPGCSERLYFPVML